MSRLWCLAGRYKGKDLIDEDHVTQLRAMVIDRFTAEELCEILGAETEDIFDRFFEECLRVDWSEHL